MPTDPAAEFGALLAGRLAGRPPAAEPDEAAAPPGPRLPAPNQAQGSSGRAGPPPLHPSEMFAEMFAGLAGGRGDGGWRKIL
jgi:hypothetical protein